MVATAFIAGVNPEHLTAGLEHDPFQQLREKLIVGLQYIAKIPRQQALLKILYHKCEFNDEMLAEGDTRKDGLQSADSPRSIAGVSATRLCSK